MIDRQNNQIFIECDECSDVFEGEPDADFDVVWPEARSQGWRASKIDDKWKHFCKDCDK